MTNSPKDPANTPGLQDYHTIADTVGFVPNFRLKDNVFQTFTVIVFGMIGAGVGWAIGAGQKVDWWVGPVLGLIAGVIAGTFLSGIVLMILGWLRAAKRIE